MIGLGIDLFCHLRSILGAMLGRKTEPRQDKTRQYKARKDKGKTKAKRDSILADRNGGKFWGDEWCWIANRQRGVRRIFHQLWRSGDTPADAWRHSQNHCLPKSHWKHPTHARQTTTRSTGSKPTTCKDYMILFTLLQMSVQFQYNTKQMLALGIISFARRTRVISQAAKMNMALLYSYSKTK